MKCVQLLLRTDVYTKSACNSYLRPPQTSRWTARHVIEGRAETAGEDCRTRHQPALCRSLARVDRTRDGLRWCAFRSRCALFQYPDAADVRCAAAASPPTSSPGVFEPVSRRALRGRVPRGFLSGDAVSVVETCGAACGSRFSSVQTPHRRPQTLASVAGAARRRYVLGGSSG